ncbi:MAG: hypothetical protein IKW49_02515 [Opitutales bacterium]|nr:hypothetical protein [Opitutales bacterium]
MNTEKIIAVLALCALATSLSGSVTDIFRDSRMFDQAYFSVSTNPEGNLSVKIAPHWAFRRTPGTKVLLFDFEHDSKSGKWFLVSDGLREEFVKPVSPGYYENWFAEAISKRNEVRAARGESLIDGKLKIRSSEEIERREAELALKRKSLLEAQQKEKELGLDSPTNTGKQKSSPQSISSQSLCRHVTWVLPLAVIFACSAGIFLWLKRRRQE